MRGRNLRWPWCVCVCVCVCVCLLGTLTAYWSAKESLGQGQSSVMAQILLLGQVQDSSNQDLLGNRSTLRAGYVVLLSRIGRVVDCWHSRFPPLWRWLKFLLQYNTQQQYSNPSVVWNWCDVTFLSGTLIAHGCENAQLLLLNSNRLVGRCLQFHKWSNKYT